jgi:CRP-like cAMP-binding protein
MPAETTQTTQSLPGLQDLFSILGNFHPLGQGIKDYLSRHIVTSKILKRKLLLREGETCHHVYFIRQGAVRGFFREGSRDITTWITIEKEVVSSISTWENPQPVTENIQALEDTELYVMTLDELRELFQRFPEFNIVVRKLLQKYYADAESRAYIARLTKAENKYLYFLKKHAPLANRIPLKYIASYLGMTLETLSRIRKKITLK